jgi:hypothetical protein
MTTQTDLYLGDCTELLQSLPVNTVDLVNSISSTMLFFSNTTE